jgi:hypothetical protein
LLAHTFLLASLLILLAGANGQTLIRRPISQHDGEGGSRKKLRACQILISKVLDLFYYFLMKYSPFISTIIMLLEISFPL